MSRHPTMKWAQRFDKVYLTIDLPEAKDVKLKLEPEGMFKFSATKDGNTYEIDIELFDKINIEESKSSIGVRSIACSIKKADKKWWGRLLKQEGKPPTFLKVDWDRWVDEDDENEKSEADFDDMDFSDLGMGGNNFDMDEFKDEEEEEATENEDKEAAAAEKENKEEQSLTEDVEETKA